MTETVPKIFMSYSWTSERHEQWVLELATRLMADGVQVVIDKWDLKEGNDAYCFMESMINDLSIKKVLLICDEVYRVKANSRSGGVGTEAQIVSKEIYENAQQERFIPIVAERVSDGSACVPTFVHSRIYIDLSKLESFEAEYDKLLRCIYDKPLHKRPGLGVMPAHLVDDAPAPFPVVHLFRRLEGQVARESTFFKATFREAFDSIIVSLSSNKVTPTEGTKNLDDEILENIDRLTPLRDTFLKLVDLDCRASPSLDVDLYHSFFERLLQLTYPDGPNSQKTLHDNYRFLSYEFVLYFTSVLVKHRKFDALTAFVSGTFFVSKNSTLSARDFHSFNCYVESLEEVRNRRLKGQRTSIVADTIKHRNAGTGIAFERIMEVDCLLWFISKVRNTDWDWFPRTLIYSSGKGHLPIFQRLASKREFQQICPLFGVQTPEELVLLAKRSAENDRRDGRSSFSQNWSLPSIESLADASVLCTLP